MERSASRVSSYRNPSTTVRALPVLVLFAIATISSGSPANAQNSSPARPKFSRSATVLKSSQKLPTNQPADSPEETIGEKIDLSAPPSKDAKPFTATAYCLKGRTASGDYPQRGTIAADFKVLPIGSVVRLHAGKYSGVYKVQDTGKHIRGSRIDVYIPTSSEARVFGRRPVKLEIIRHGRVPKKSQPKTE